MDLQCGFECPIVGKEPQIHFSDGLPLDHRVSLGSNLMGQIDDIHSTISPFGSKSCSPVLTE